MVQSSRLNKGHNLVQTDDRGHYSVQITHKGHGFVQTTHIYHSFILAEVMTQAKGSHKVTTQYQQPQRWSQFNIVGRQPFNPQGQGVPTRWGNNSFRLSFLNKFIYGSHVLLNSLLCLGQAKSNEYGIHIPLQIVLGILRVLWNNLKRNQGNLHSYGSHNPPASPTKHSISNCHPYAHALHFL